MYTREKVRDLTIPAFVLPTAELISEFSNYKALFFFYRRGITDLVDASIDRWLKISKDYQPANYYEYDDLLQIALHDLDAYSFRFMKGRTISPNSVDVLEIAIEDIDAAVGKMLAKSMPPCEYVVRHRKWCDDVLTLTLVLP